MEDITKQYIEVHKKCNQKSKFYAHGKWFDDKKEFFKFIKEWPDMPIDLNEFKSVLDALFKTIEINNELREGKLTNKLAYQILAMHTDWVKQTDEP